MPAHPPLSTLADATVAPSGMCHCWGGVLTLTWYTYMCLPFGALFREIWYSDDGVFIIDDGVQTT